MKINQLVLTLCLFVVAVAAQAQPTKGSILIGGDAGFQAMSQGEYNATNITLSPLAGFFVTDRVAVGGQVTMQFFGGDAEGSIIGLGPAVRYYFNGDGSARFFGQGNFNWLNFDPGGDFDSDSGIGFGAGVGLDYFFNEHVALEAILGYNNFKFSDEDDATNTFGLSIGVAAFIGGGN